jgi:metal-dependent amidase/aminoacylase/carboxypeptidase family protein
VTSIHGGTANNIFPETVEMKGTLRTFDNEWREAIHNEITIISNATCFMYNTKCDIEIRKGYPPVINDPVITEIAKAAIGELNNNLKSVDIEPIMWAEDFAYFAEKVPSTFWFLGIKPENADQMAPLHNPRFNPDEGAILYGTALLVGAAVKALESFEEIV